MDLTGNELLPRSRLALNQHRRSSRCGALDLLALVAHSRGVADELVFTLFFFAQLIDLSLPQIRRRIRLVDLLGHFADDDSAGGVDEPLELLEMLPYVVPGVGPLAWRPDEDRSLDRGRQLN